MEWKRGETFVKVAKKQNKKAERSRNNFQTSSTNSDFNHSHKMVTIRGG
ncbi:hypothetical protein [Lactobacillus intestinalis]|nr:hypothetical protein [Lactobacillus intestinalis]